MPQILPDQRPLVPPSVRALMPMTGPCSDSALPHPSRAARLQEMELSALRRELRHVPT